MSRPPTPDSTPTVHEPPARVSVEGVEPHPHKTGYRLFDLIVAGSAILISCISLFIAVEHGHTMQKLVAANSWPLLQATTGNSKGGKPLINMTVSNVGWALRSFALFMWNTGGRDMTTPTNS